ncbi:MAG: peptidylprolyl isomerase [Myxococcota bacterium]
MLHVLGTPPRPTSARALRFAVVVGVLTTSACGSCTDGDVVATVGPSKLGREDLRLRMETMRRHDGTEADAVRQLVDAELLATGARKARLAERDDVKARLASAEREVLAQAYLDEKLNERTTEDAVRRRYAEKLDTLKRRRVHVRQIAIHVPASIDATQAAEAERQGRERARTLYARLRAGEDFPAMARAESDDKGTAEKGGDLGPVLEGQVDAAFFRAAWDLKLGDLSEPVRTPYGFHILQPVESAAEVTPRFDEVKGRLAADMRAEGRRELLRGLREDIDVEVHVAGVAEGGLE